MDFVRNLSARASPADKDAVTELYRSNAVVIFSDKSSNSVRATDFFEKDSYMNSDKLNVVDLTKEKRAKYYISALTEMTGNEHPPFIYIDKEFIGNYKDLRTLNENFEIIPLLQAAGALPKTKVPANLTASGLERAASRDPAVRGLSRNPSKKAGMERDKSAKSIGSVSGGNLSMSRGASSRSIGKAPVGGKFTVDDLDLAYVEEVAESNSVVVFIWDYDMRSQAAVDLLRGAQLNKNRMTIVNLDKEERGKHYWAALRDWTGKKKCPYVFIGTKYVGDTDDLFRLNMDHKVVPKLKDSGALDVELPKPADKKDPSLQRQLSAPDMDFVNKTIKNNGIVIFGRESQGSTERAIAVLDNVGDHPHFERVCALKGVPNNLVVVDLEGEKGMRYEKVLVKKTKGMQGPYIFIATEFIGGTDNLLKRAPNWNLAV